jgi:hypothetical protein
MGYSNATVSLFQHFHKLFLRENVNSQNIQGQENTHSNSRLFLPLTLVYQKPVFTFFLDRGKKEEESKKD